MIKMIVRHELAITDRANWMEVFEQKRAIRETCGISQRNEPTVYINSTGEIVVIHEIEVVTIKDAIKVLDHIKANSESRKNANAIGKPCFSV